MFELLAGVFYFFNKIFFACAEYMYGKASEKKWRIRAWEVYLCGLPFWLIIFAREENWIAFSVEGGGAPSMILGLIIALKGKGKEPRWLNTIALVATTIGIAISMWHFGGINRIEQWLELVLATGFLGGTFLLAKERSIGYVFFMAMNSANAYLMYIQGYTWLAGQQIFSLVVMAYAYWLCRSRNL